MGKELTHLGEIFREDFLSSFHVAKNGGGVTGSPTINNGYEGVSGHAVTYNNINWRNHPVYSIHVEVERFDSVSDQGLVSATTSTGPLFRLFNGTTLQFFSDQSASPFFNATVNVSAGEGGTFGASFDSGTQVVRLYHNGNFISQKTAMPVANSADSFLQLFSRITTNSSLNGKGKRVRIFDRVLTDEEFADLYNNSTFTEIKQPVAYHAFNDKIGSAAPFTTSDLSQYGNDATLGDGSTSTTFPTKLSGRNGFNFDGTTDYMEIPDIQNVKTVLIWANNNPDANYRRLITKGDNALSMLIWVDGTYRVYFQNTTSAINSNITPSPGLNMFGITFDGTNIKTYVNDVAGSSTIRSNYTDNSVFTVGKYAPSNIQHWNSDMYSIAMWDIPLTPLQIRHVYSQGPYYLGNK